MYKTYFGLRERPFAIAPDPSFLFMSELHREALAHLLYGVKSDAGFVLLTGEVGTGKTTICRCLLEQIPETSKVAYVINPRLSVVELLATICDEFGIEYPPGNNSIKLFVDLINEYLLAAHAGGYKPVLIIDEAQNLSYELLEQVRLLTNLETNERKLLLIIMLGQPELRQKLFRPELRQLQQRITARYHLGPLSRRDTFSYINHRLDVAGAQRKLFKQSALRKIFKLSGGVPRLINLLCDRALLGAYVQGEGKIAKRIVAKSADEIMDSGRRMRPPLRSFSAWALAGILVMLCTWGLMSGKFANFIDQDGVGHWVETSALGRWVAKAGLASAKPMKIADLPSHWTKKKATAAGISNAAAGQSLPAAAEEDTQVCMDEDNEAGTSAPDHLVWPADKSISKSKIMAYQSLFAQWGSSYDPSKYRIACNQAMTIGLSCLYKQGNMGSVRRFNRPAVMRLLDRNGQEYFATLIGVQGRQARIVVGGVSETVAIEELEAQWTGTYTLLWKMPPGYQGAVLPGKSAPWLPWLTERLAVPAGREKINDQDRTRQILQGRLLAQVKRFQHDNGLPPDGILGPQTLISLNSVRADSSFPSLTTPMDFIQITKN